MVLIKSMNYSGDISLWKIKKLFCEKIKIIDKR